MLIAFLAAQMRANFIALVFTGAACLSPGRRALPRPPTAAPPARFVMTAPGLPADNDFFGLKSLLPKLEKEELAAQETSADKIVEQARSHMEEFLPYGTLYQNKEALTKQ